MLLLFPTLCVILLRTWCFKVKWYFVSYQRSKSFRNKYIYIKFSRKNSFECHVKIGIRFENFYIILENQFIYLSSFHLEASLRENAPSLRQIIYISKLPLSGSHFKWWSTVVMSICYSFHILFSLSLLFNDLKIIIKKNNTRFVFWWQQEHVWHMLAHKSFWWCIWP